MRRLPGGAGVGTVAVAFSPDSRFVVAARGVGHGAWDLRADSPPALLHGAGAGGPVGFLAPGVLLARSGPTWVGIDLASGATAHLVTLLVPSSVGAARPSGRLVKLAGWAGDRVTVVQNYLVDAAGGPHAGAPVDIAGPTRYLVFSPDGRRYVADKYSGELDVRDSATDAPVAEAYPPPGPSANRPPPVWAPDGSRVVVLRKRGLFGFDAATGEPVAGAELPEQPSRRGLALHPAGRLGATVDGSRVVAIRDAATLAERRRLDFGLAGLVAVAFSPDGLLGAVASSRGRVLLFDVED